MSLFALTLVLSAAVMHASWNAVVKAATDRAISLSAVTTAHTVAGAILIAVAGMPDASAWPYIIASTVIHYGYYMLMFQAYRLGDLSQVYPISRGMAPVLVALGTYLMIGEELSTVGWTGLAMVTAGIGLLALQRGAAHSSPRAVGVAACLGLTIAAYSVADGIGVRVSDNPLAYMGWLFLLEAPVTVLVLGNRRRLNASIDWRVFRIGLIGGTLSVVAYGLVLYAKTIAPIAAVSAVRESSVIIAALIGLFLFGERPWLGRMIAATVVGGGVIILAFS